MPPQSFVDLSHFRLGHLRHWYVNLIPRRVDSLPYSKIKAICNTYRRRLVDSRRAPDTPTALPTATTFISTPTPSYVLSPQLASRLSKAEFSSLASKLRVYETVPVGEPGDFEAGFVVEEKDCTPEVIIEPDMGGGDQALYFGHGQLHVIGMLDMHTAEVKENVRFSSAADLRRLLASEFIRHETDAEFDDAASSVYYSMEEGRQEIARVSADVDYAEGIATASLTFNLNVPTAGFDPDRTCPYNRLAAVGMGSPVTSFRALRYLPASFQDRSDGLVSEEDFFTNSLHFAVQGAMGNGPFPMNEFADHSRALGASDPDLERDEEDGVIY